MQVCQGSTVFDVSDATCVDPAVIINTKYVSKKINSILKLNYFIFLNVCFVCPTINGNANFADPDCPAQTCCTYYKNCNNGTPSNQVYNIFQDFCISKLTILMCEITRIELPYWSSFRCSKR
jgi:hypothetical protein